MAQYVRIESINAPASAAPGETVQVWVEVKNLYNAPLVYRITGRVGTSILQFGATDTTLTAWGTGILADEFVMPSASSAIEIWTWWKGTDGKYYEDDHGVIQIQAVGAPPATELDTLTLNVARDTYGVGQPIPYTLTYRYKGPAQQCRLYFQYGTGLYPSFNLGGTLHPQQIAEEDIVVLSLPPSTSKVALTKTGTFVTRWALTEGQTYSVRANMTTADGVSGSDVDYNAFIFRGAGLLLTGLRSTSINVTYSAYDFGATVPYVLGYDYKGEAQSGTLKIELGTGVYPYFTPSAVVDPVSYNFAKKEIYTRVTENRTFVLPSTLVRGQTYSVRVTLTTADGLADNDIDYTALKVLDTTVPSTDLQGLVITPTYREYALGETYSFSISYRYKGIAQSGTKSIVIRKLASDVYTYTQIAVQYDRADTLTIVSSSESVVLPRSLEPGQVYSLYVRLSTADGKTTSDTKGTAFKIAGTEVPDPRIGEYRKIKDHIYPYAESYRDAASEATVEITVPLAQLPGGDWISKKVIDEFEKGVAENGAHMLQLVVYEREHGTTSKDYKLVATATKPKDVAGQEYTTQGIMTLAYVNAAGLPLAVWALIVLGVLLALGFIISAVVPIVREGVWGEGGFAETITGIGGLLGDVIPMMVIVIMLTLVMEQTREIYEPPGAPPRPKPVTEKAIKIAKWVGEEAVELAQRGWEEAKSLLSRKRTEWAEAHAEDKKGKAEEVRQAEERERESRKKLREAKAELRKRREERSA